MTNQTPVDTATTTTAPEAPPPGVPTVSEVDGWTVTSGSMGTSQSDALMAALAPEGTATPAPAPEADAPEADAPEAGEAEEAQAATPAARPDRPKKHTPATQRIAELQAQIRALTAQKHQERAALEQVRAERAQWQAAAGAPTTTTTAPEPSVFTSTAVGAGSATTTAVPAGDPKPTWAAFEAEGKAWDEYAEALDQWQERRWAARVQETETRVQARLAQERAAAEAEDANRAYAARLDAIKATRPDFDARVQANLADIPQTPFLTDLVRQHPAGVEVLDYLADHPAQAQTLSTLTLEATHAMMDVMQQTADPRPLLGYLAEHPDEFARLAALPPRAALVALGSLSGRLTGAMTGSLQPTPRTMAPAPIQPVGAVRGTGPTRATPLEDLPFDEYVRRANQQEREARRRP